MTNIFWPVFKNLEEEMNRLMFNIHIDDNQLNVYSSKIADLILRAATEIESLSKELYLSNGGTKSENIKYDHDALKYLNKIWSLDKKIVIISSYNCFQSNRIIEPFQQKEKRSGSNKNTYSWNNSYQNLKHDRANSLEYGSIAYLFDIMAALYVLNLYYKDDSYELGKDSISSNFDPQVGSNIFSIKLHKSQNINIMGGFNKEADFEECTFLVKPTDKATEYLTKTIEEINEENKQIKMNKLVEQFKSEKFSTAEEAIKLLKEKAQQKQPDNFTSLLMQRISEINKELNFEAVLNKNQF